MRRLISILVAGGVLLASGCAHSNADPKACAAAVVVAATKAAEREYRSNAACQPPDAGTSQ